MDVEELEKHLKNDSSPIVIDVREEFELEISKLERAIHIPMNEIPNRVNELDKNKEIIITAKKDGGLNVVSVTDQGIGIPKESIHRITERFFTVDPSKSRSVGGTGLGLAIVKHLVSQHRAELYINSVEY